MSIHGRFDWNALNIEALKSYWNTQSLRLDEIMVKPEFAGRASEGAVFSKIERLRTEGILVKHRGRPDLWPQGLVDVAMAYWNAGVSAGEMLAKPEFIEMGFTRNAIIGKIHRTVEKQNRRQGGPSERRELTHEQRVHNAKVRSPETWPAKPKETAEDRRARHARAAEGRRQTIAERAARREAKRPTGPGVPLMEHPDTCCKFIVAGDGREALWCIEPKTDGSYCGYHYRVCHHV